MLTSEQRSQFDEQGFLRLRGVFSPEDAAAMEERVWTTLAKKHGMRQDDPESWRVPTVFGLQGLRTHAVFEPIGGPVLLGALDDLIGEGRWAAPKHWGSLLVSFPASVGNPPVSMPGWHTDFPYTVPADRVVGAIVFSYLGNVAVGSGATLAMAGSHRVVRRFIEAKPHLRKLKMKVTRQALMSSDPFLKSLAEADRSVWLAHALDSGEQIVDGVSIRIVELVGEAGDVVLGHPWLLHSASPNRGDRPRFMRVQRIGAAY